MSFNGKDSACLFYGVHHADVASCKLLGFPRGYLSVTARLPIMQF